MSNISNTIYIYGFSFGSIQVALVYSSNDPINFICAFYGCLLAGIVPLPIDVPLARRVCIR
jgi:acyl-CoA synthetase (AMP-forming)/AMP-acid ligase II